MSKKKNIATNTITANNNNCKNVINLFSLNIRWRMFRRGYQVVCHRSEGRGGGAAMEYFEKYARNVDHRIIFILFLIFKI